MATTMADVRRVIQGEMEPTEPADTVLRVLRENDGKRFDKRLIDKVKAATGGDTFRRHDIAGMAHLEWGNYGERCCRSDDDGGSLLMAYALTNVRIDAEWVEEHNCCHYSARDERNAQRVALLADRDTVGALARAVTAEHKASATITALTNHGAPAWVARYDIRKAFGLAD